MKRRAHQGLGLAAFALSAGVAHAQVVPFTGHVLQDFINSVTDGIDRARDPFGQDLALPDSLADRSSGYDIDEVRASYDPQRDSLFVGIRAFGIAGDVDGDGNPGAAGPELVALGGLDVPHFGAPESFALMFDFDEDGIFDMVAGVPFMGAIDPNNLQRLMAGPNDGNGFQVSAFVGGANGAFAPGAAFGAPVDSGWRLHASPNARQPDLEFEILGFSSLSEDYLSGLNGPDLSRFFRVDVYMGSAGDAVGEDFLNGSFLRDPPVGDNPPPQMCPPGFGDVELCNNFDDDCDREIDEAPLFRIVQGRPVAFADIICVTGLPGICGEGVPNCAGGIETCIPTIRPGQSDEVCNGVDDDCDGQVDENTQGDPLPGVGVVCESGRPGICSVGTQQCLVGVLTCVPDGDGMAEVCNASDDDCDGTVDEGFAGVGQACQNGVGACARDGMTICSADGLTTQCDAAPAGDPRAELCNAQDDDCDGSTDETFADLGQACTVGVGACGASGVMMCAMDGQGTVCSAQAGRECCGNGAVDAGEDCDDNNASETDGCTNQCRACGNGACDQGETSGSCPEDCDPCGNGTCDPGETPTSCPADCDACGNGICEPTESVTSCPQDCTCGNGTCDIGETSNSCPGDCGGDAGMRAPVGKLTGADLSDNCSTTGGSGSSWWFALLAVPLLRRRRRVA